MNVQDEDGKTALMWAAGGDEEIVMLLLANGANVHVKDKQGHTALNYAERSKYAENKVRKEIEELLKKAGAKD